jgi:hypothetical protein
MIVLTTTRDEALKTKQKSTHKIFEGTSPREQNSVTTSKYLKETQLLNKLFLQNKLNIF